MNNVSNNYQEPHGATSQKTTFFTDTAMKTSNLIQSILFYYKYNLFLSMEYYCIVTWNMNIFTFFCFSAMSGGISEPCCGEETLCVRAFGSLKIQYSNIKQNFIIMCEKQEENLVAQISSSFI
jgi:hypothetical protein